MTTLYIEEPIRKSRIFERSRRSRRRSRVSASSYFAGLGAVLLTIVAGVIVVNSLTSQPSSEPFVETVAAPRSSIASEDEEHETSSTAVDELHQSIAQAMSMDAWPEELREPLDNFDEEAWLNDSEAIQCLDVVAETTESCYFPVEGGDKTAVLLGDSVAVSWIPPLRAGLHKRGYNLQVLTHSMCPFASVDVTGMTSGDEPRDGYPEECNEHRSWAFEQVRSLSPDLLVTSDGEVEMQALAGISAQEDRARTWQVGVSESINEIPDIRTIILSSPPASKSVGQCYNRLSTPTDCSDRLSQQWTDQFRATLGGIEDTAKNNVTLVDTKLWFCTPTGWCPAFAGGNLIRGDQQHISSAYSVSLTSVVDEMLSRELAIAG